MNRYWDVLTVMILVVWAGVIATIVGMILIEYAGAK